MSVWTTLEILGWLIVAAVIGFVIGWLVSRLFRDEQLGMEAEFLAAKAETANARVRALKAELAGVKAGPADGALQSRLEKALAERAEAADEAVDLRRKLSEREAEVVGLRARMRSIESRLAAAEEIAEQAVRDDPPPTGAPNLSREREVLMAATKAAEKATLDLAQAQVQTRALRDELEVHVSRLDNVANQLNEHSAVPADALVRDDIAGRLADLEARVAKGCRADALEARLVALMEAAPPPPVDDDPESSGEAALDVSPYAAKAPDYRTPEPPDAVSQAKAIAARNAVADGHQDDLRAIKGIGPKIESLLHGLGFVCYGQLAILDDDEIQIIGDALEVFSDRMIRDNWAGQAMDLCGADCVDPNG